MKQRQGIEFVGKRAPLSFMLSEGANQFEAESSFAEGWERTAHDLRVLNEQGVVLSTSLRAQLAWLSVGNPLGFGGFCRYADHHSIVREIEHLEGLRRETCTREPSKLHGLLEGFCHKHFYDLHSLFINLRREVDDNFDRLFYGVFKKRVEDATGEPLFGSVLDEKRIAALAHTMGIYAFDDRRGANSPTARSRLTGEWIVYAEQGGKKHFLTLAWHAEEGNKLQSLAARLWAVGEEMPFVRDRLRKNGVYCEIETQACDVDSGNSA